MAVVKKMAFVFAAALAVPPLLAETKSPSVALATHAMFEGSWEGSITTGTTTRRVRVHLSRAVDGLFVGRLDAIEQDVSLPLDHIQASGQSLRFGVERIGGSYDGTLNDEGTQIRGTWSQGTPLALNLTRMAGPAGAPSSPTPAAAENFVTLPSGAYFGQAPPGPAPQVFAPGLISLPGRGETRIAFSPDGREAFIRVKGRLLYTAQEDGRWSAIRTASFLGDSSDAVADFGEPFVAPDGQRLFLIRSADIWVSTRQNGAWAKPSPFPAPINTPAQEWHPTVASDGTLYFCSNRDTPPGGYAIYRSRLKDGQYRDAEKLDGPINSEYGAWDPFIAPDETYLIFSSVRPGGYGKADQYISNYRNGTWSEPRNLGPVINTSEVEYGSYVSPDGKYYFFAKPQGAEAHIFWVDSRAVLAETAGQ